MSHVDLHLHLLPGVDDGPRDLGEALAHAERMALAHVHEAVVTPHLGHPDFPVDARRVAGLTAALQAEIDTAGIDLRVRPGAEIHPTGPATLTREELHAVAQGPPRARWVLLEAPFAGVDAAFLVACAAIRAHGLGLVIAHPERAPGLLDGGLKLLRPELARGAVLQVNVDSLLGRHGTEAREAGQRLVRSGMAYVLASDGHAGTRAHTLGAGFDLAIAAGASPVRAWQLTQANPRFLLRHGLPPVGGAARPRRTEVTAARDAARRLARQR